MGCRNPGVRESVSVDLRLARSLEHRVTELVPETSYDDHLRFLP